MPDVAFIDGVEVDADHTVLALRDRSVLHGDSVFEVIRVYAGRPFALEEHLGRLQRSAQIVGRVFPCSVGRLASEVHAAVARSGLADAHVRVLLTRGVGGDGLALEGVRGAHRIVWVRDLPEIPSTVYEDGIRACSIEHTVGGVAADLCRAKSGNYLARVIALTRAKQRGFDDALLVDDRGQAWEATAANLFAVVQGRLLTPPTSGPILAGVTRGAVIDLASESSIAVREATLQWTELLAADEVFVTSTIREVVSVVMVDDHVVGDGKPGVMAGALRRALRHRTGAR
jgi:branched-chain amino acid aminotransferase